MREQRKDGKTPQALGRRLAHRYECLELLGSGGSANVYRALDTATQNEVALKQLHGHRSSDHRVALFEREFHTLAQLAHPNVIAAYDYGVDPGVGPFYTMELLPGGDLRDRVPLPYRETCRLLFEVCSSLALLHSRRLLHRDITPRNIRCTRDGRAKLIDFGALGPMVAGGSETIGTPAFTPPEAVLRSALDGRADLFSLGATLYFALTGELAYPARSFAEAMSAWNRKPAPPSARVPQIPFALDDLTMSLLSIEPAARPRSAFEVMQRLAAIADLPRSEHERVPRAYLTTPQLVGREALLTELRAPLKRAHRNQGAGLLLRAAPGGGRSRLLDVFALEAEISGATVLRSVASAGADRFAVALALTQHLVASQERWLELAQFQYLFARREPVDDQSGLMPKPARLALRPASDLIAEPKRLRRAIWRMFLRVSQKRTLVVAIDDAHRIDEDSAGVLAALLDRAPRQALLIALTAPAEPTGDSKALSLLARRCEQRSLAPLTQADMRELFGSVFGDVANLEHVATEIHRLARGSPRQALELAQHLLDGGALQYSGGSWSLPSQLTAEHLPHSAQAAMEARVAALEPTARAVAELHALAFEDGFSLGEYRLLLPALDARSLDAAISALIEQQLLTAAGDRYLLSHQAWLGALRARVSPLQAQQHHRALAQLFAARAQPLARIHHLFEAGLDEQGLDALIARNSEYAQRYDHTSALQMNISQLGPCYVRAIETAIRLGRPPREIHELRRWLVLTSTIIADAAYFWSSAPIWLEQLSRDSGLSDYRGAAEPDLMRALTQAHQRYTATPEAERVYTVEEAIRFLAEYVVSAHAIASRTMDQTLLWTLPSLLEPFAPLSPLLEAMWQNMIAACEAGCECRYEQARVRYRAVLDKLASVSSQEFPQVVIVRAGIAATLAVLDSALGLASATDWAAQLEGDVLLRAGCITIRRLARLEQGDWVAADRLRRQAELAALQVRAPELLVSLLTVELSAYAHARDLVGVKDVSQRMQSLAALHPGWRPYARDAQARFDLVRGDYAAAKRGFESALELVPVDARWRTPGIPVWITAQTGLSEALLGLEQPLQARAVAAAALAMCEAAEVQSHSYELIRALALAEAQLGQHDTALARLERLIRRQVAAGVGGLRLGVTYEACAQVAIWARDEDALRVYAQLTAREYRYGASSPLSARYQRLMNEAQRGGMSCMPNLAALRASVRAGASDDLTLTQSMTRTRQPG